MTTAAYCIAKHPLHGCLCDQPEEHDGPHRRSPLHDEHREIVWDDDGNDPRCQHEHDPLNPGRRCDSRCNESAAFPWHRTVPHEDGGGGSIELAHAWCLPRRYTAEGWERGSFGNIVDEWDCARCGGSMARFPR